MMIVWMPAIAWATKTRIANSNEEEGAPEGVQEDVQEGAPEVDRIPTTIPTMMVEMTQMVMVGVREEELVPTIPLPSPWPLPLKMRESGSLTLLMGLPFLAPSSFVSAFTIVWEAAMEVSTYWIQTMLAWRLL